jgi:hypothetical protein
MQSNKHKWYIVILCLNVISLDMNVEKGDYKHTKMIVNIILLIGLGNLRALHNTGYFIIIYIIHDNIC